jgi:2-polyprenyl-3-methyl-5-hydroxy-6-metoxy-1,4-benzoquinol methylase
MLNNFDEQLTTILNSHDPSQISQISLEKLFHNTSDDFWIWLFTEGYDNNPAVKKILPSLPDEQTQINFTGRSGHSALRDAFSIYQLIKKLSQEYSKNISDSRAILDFGCGWGRIIRFFLRDLNEKKIYGVDCYDQMIQLCKTQNLRSNFQTINPMPPTKFLENMFDHIYLYSVFSHLSEEAHLEWLKEFNRILSPGGIVIASTRPRSFIEYCVNVSKKTNIEMCERGLAISFRNSQKDLKDYDQGKFVHCPTGGGDVLDKSFFGETCISKLYVEKEWIKYFSEVHYFTVPEHGTSDQDIIVAIK